MGGRHAHLRPPDPAQARPSRVVRLEWATAAPEQAYTAAMEPDGRRRAGMVQ